MSTPLTVTLVSDATITATEDGGTETIVFTSATEWSLRYDEEYDWLAADPESGDGSSEEQTITLQIAPNTGSDRSATLTIYSSPLAKKSITVSQSGPEGDGVREVTILEFLTEQNTTTTSRIRGVVSDYANSSYYGFDLSDGTGTVACAFPDNWTDYSDQIEDGDTVAIQGVYSYYESNSEAQLKNGTIVEHVKGPVWEIPTVTVAEFIATADAAHEYRLSGTISSFNSSYCSFNLTDDTGTIYVYSVTSDTKTQYASVLQNGYKVTLTGKYYLYNSTHEVVSATIESYEEVAATTYEFSGTVVAAATYSFLVKDSTGEYYYVYDRDITVTVSVGDQVTVTAEKTTYQGLTEYENYTVTTTGTETVTHPEATALTGTDFDSYSTTFGYVSFTGALTISGSYYNIAVSGASCVGSLVNPVSLDSSLSGKNVDVVGYYLYSNGSSTTYKNVIITSVTESEDQSGTDTGDDSSSSSDVSLEPGEDEVLYTLTNAEIVATMSQTSGSSYGDATISSAGGDWTGKICYGSSKTFLQINKTAYLTSPTYSTEVKRMVIEFKADEFTSSTARPICALAPVDPSNLPSASDALAAAYASVSVTKETAADLQSFEFNTTGVTQFSILSTAGAAYINAIYVFCAK